MGVAAFAQTPIVHYTFEDNVLDVSGNGNNGTVVGSPTYVTGSPGQAIYFNNPSGGNSATQYVSVPDLSSLDDSSFTVAMKIKSTDTSQDNGRFFGNNIGAVGIGMNYNRNATANALIGASDDSNHIYLFDVNAGSEGIVTDGNWHWMVMVMDRTNGDFQGYIDGAMEQTSLAGFGAVSMDNLLIGSSLFGGQTDFAAQQTAIDEFYVFNSALSESQVFALTSTNTPEPGSLALLAGVCLPAAVGTILRRRAHRGHVSSHIG